MKTKWNLLMVFVLLATLVGGMVSPAKAEGEIYAVSVYLTEGVQNPEAALGAPDGVYATFDAEGGGIMLDMGAPMQGSLTIYHSTKSPSCQVQAGVMGTVVLNGYTVAGADHTTFIVTSDIQYVAIVCNAIAKKATGFQLDAVQVTPIVLPEGYAMAVYGIDGDVQNTGAALGAPDGIYATFGPTGGTIVLDMGTVVQGSLTIYHSTKSPSCQVQAGLPGSQELVLNAYTVAGADHTTFIVASDFQYVAIVCNAIAKKATGFQLDAVQVTPLVLPEGYAKAVYATQGDIQNAGAALGAPDGQYALITGFSDITNPIYLQLDMGAQVTGTLTFYHTSITAPCMFLASTDPIPLDFYDLTGYVAMGATRPNAVTSTFTSPAAFRYITVLCSAQASIGLDAVQVQPEMPKWYAARSILDPNGQGVFMTGAPDGQSAPALDQNVTPPHPVVLDMGAPVHGLLTVYHTAVTESCMAEVTDSNGTLIAYLGPTSPGATSSTFYVADDFQYFQIEGPYSSPCTLEVDALEVASGEVTLDGYGYIFFAGAAVKNPTAALGAPDGLYASLPAGASSYISLDLGAPFQGVLTITHSSTSPACKVYESDVFDPSGFAEVGHIFTGSTVSILPIPASKFPGGIRYVVIDCSSLTTGTLDLDAVGVHPAVTTGYGQQVLYITGSVKNANYAVGPRDGLYATIGAPSGEIMLYVGMLVDKPVTIYHSATSQSCTVYGATLDFLNTGGPLFVVPTTAGTTSTTITPPAGEEISFIGVTCSGLAKKQAFQLDAVQVTP